MTEPILTILFAISCLAVLLVFAPKSKFLLKLSRNPKVTSERDKVFIRGIGEMIASFAAYPGLLLLSIAFNRFIGESIEFRHTLTVVVIVVNFAASWGLRRWWKRVMLTLNGYVDVKER